MSHHAHHGAVAAEPSRTIGELAGEFGVSLRTLRFYEDKGMLRPRREGTRRLYAPADRERLGAILRAKALGFTLREIRTMLREVFAAETAAEAPGPQAAGVRDAPAPIALRLSPDKVAEQIAYLRARKVEIERALRALEDYRRPAQDAA